MITSPTSTIPGSGTQPGLGVARATKLSQSIRNAIVAASGLLGMIAATDARADFKICNRMSYVVEAAIAVDMHAATAARGWFRLNPAQCRTIAQGHLTADRVLLHARALPIYGATPASQTRGETLCITQDNFVIAAARQCRSGQTPAQFTEVQPSTSEGGDQIAWLAEEADYDDEQARLAGIQRLLMIAGYDATPIDGVDGRKTQNALASFLRDKNLSPALVSTDEFFDAMIEAIEKPSGKSLAWCNETPHRVMAAIATSDGGTTTSRGWYRVEAGKCVHPDIDGQPKQIFSFAEAVDSSGRAVHFNGRPLNWGGDVMLCTRDSKFELRDHQDCRSHGLISSGFARVTTGQGDQTIRLKLP